MPEWMKHPDAKALVTSKDGAYDLAPTGGAEAAPTGRELDALVAEKVFGYVGIGYYGPTKPKGGHRDYLRYDTPAEALAKYREHWPVPSQPSGEEDVSLCHWKEGWGPLLVEDFSTEISDAWQVVEKLNAGYHAVIKSPFTPEEQWIAGFTPHNCTGWNGRPDYTASADDAPLAICLAALRLATANPLAAAADTR